MDVLTLRGQLATVLGPFLGDYTLANGVTTPAIAVRSAGEGLAPGGRVSGLECVILTEPDLTPVKQYQGQGALRDWSVYLTDWAGDASLNTIAGILLYSFSGSTVTTISVPERMGPKNQMLLKIPSSSGILNYTPPSGLANLELPKSISITSPVVGDDFTLFRADTDVTLTAVVAVLQGSASPSVTFVIKYAASRTASGTAATISTTVTSTTTGTNVAIDQMPIPADSFVWLEISAVSGTVDELSVTLET
jgi:hypothetical protein